MKKFSILTSIYQSEKFLKNYFRTISIQKYKPEEIILVDDTKNPKNLKKILENYKKKYKFKKIVLIKNKKNLGPAKSLNIGLKKTKIDLIFRLDVDDTWKKNHISTFLNYHEKDSNCLIYAVSIKNSNLRNKIKCDDYFINENHTLHSSWLINRKINRKFKYMLENPVLALEDYATIAYYIRRNFKIYTTNQNSINYNSLNPFSHGKSFNKNIHFINKKKEIALRQFIYSYKKFGKSKFRIINILSFIIFKFGILKFFVFIFWTLDLVKLKILLKK
jgi:glycosyltransferase involved in cell wall biosynthesis